MALSAAAIFSFSALPLYPPAQAPIIGILALPVDHGDCVTVRQQLFQDEKRQSEATSCFHSLYVQWLEAAGARVAPIPFDLPSDQFNELIGSLNGAVFTGGGSGIDTSLSAPFMQAAARLYQHALTMHAQGHVWPLWGTCFGMQVLSMLGAHDPSVVVPHPAEHLVLPLELTPAAKSSQFLEGLPADVLATLTTRNATVNLHNYGVDVTAFERAPLRDAFSVLSTNLDTHHRPFASTIEAANGAPIFGAQWHPERPQFEWTSGMTFIERSDAEATAMFAVAQRLVAFARRSTAAFATAAAEHDALIYNYRPSGSSSYQAYFFTPQATAAAHAALPPAAGTHKTTPTHTVFLPAAPTHPAFLSASNPHEAVRDAIVSAMNDFASAPTALLALLHDDASWCDPYPDGCVHGKPNLSSFLNSMPPGTATILLPEALVTVGPVGGMMTTLSFSWPGSSPSCLYTADQHVSWRLSNTTYATNAADDTAGATAAPPTLAYVRWVYNASAFDVAMSACLGHAAAPLQRLRSLANGAQPTATIHDEHTIYTAQLHAEHDVNQHAESTVNLHPGHTPTRHGERDADLPRVTSRGRGGQRGERDADLLAVQQYVVSLQYSLAAQALICDLLVPSARYCDPYPLRCAIGREGCRAMKGLPPSAPPDPAALAQSAASDDSAANDSDDSAASAAGDSFQCRPGSVRPLMPTGRLTGAMYLTYSSANRSGGKLRHKLHHTWAIWTLAPTNSSSTHASHLHQPPAPMLASFDWFMPDHNV